MNQVISGLIISLFLGFLSVASCEALPVGFTLSPLRTELSIDPGTSQDGTLSLTNNNDHPITVSLSVEEFSVIDPQYDYSFNATTQLTKWVTFTPDLLSLDVGQTKQVKFTVGVPLNAEPGGRYLSMFATTDAGSPTDGLVSQQRIASLIYLTVNGDFTRSGQLMSLNAPWFLTGSSNWTATLHNTGSTHFNSRYNIAVQTLFDSKTISETSGSALVLPGTVRLIKDYIPLPDFPGIYKEVYTIGLGDSPAITETRYIVYLPPAVIIALVATIVALVPLVNHYRAQRKKVKSN